MEKQTNTNKCKMCDAPAELSRGLCRKHYQAAWKAGKLDLFPYQKLTLADRMMKKVKIDESGCWIWLGQKNYYGYGLIWKNGKAVKAHREMYRLTNTRFDESYVICHKCDNPSCVNPSHLYAGTQQDNSTDMVCKNRHAAGERSGLARLTTDQILEIRLDKRSQSAIAKSFGTSQGHISKIKARKRRSSE